MTKRDHGLYVLVGMELCECRAIEGEARRLPLLRVPSRSRSRSSSRTTSWRDFRGRACALSREGFGRTASVRQCELPAAGTADHGSRDLVRVIRWVMPFSQRRPKHYDERALAALPGTASTWSRGRKAGNGRRNGPADTGDLEPSLPKR
jgi:hypothetical protein